MDNSPGSRIKLRSDFASIDLMSETTEHGRLIAAAANAALAPLGCRRRGRSRFWFSDERFWVVSIEFQPSGWSKGSYLNVGAAWLWSERAGFGFDVGYRVSDFIHFESVDQFSPLIKSMATRAADEVSALRAKFNSLGRVHDYLLECAGRDGWSTYHAAVAAGLSGDVSSSRLFFHQLAHWPTHGYGWEKSLKATAAKLAKRLDRPNEFRAAVVKLIGRRRKAIGLEPDRDCLG